jgi:hypothetical protein
MTVGLYLQRATAWRLLKFNIARAVGESWLMSQWIKCSDRMPLPFVFVLISVEKIKIHWNGLKIQIAMLENDDEFPESSIWSTPGGKYNFKPQAVTHWMPLPEPPK